jgi:transposase-like protein
MKRDRPTLPKGRHFEAEIIVLCVRWYLRFGLSFRNLEELMVKRRNLPSVCSFRTLQAAGTAFGPEAFHAVQVE